MTTKPISADRLSEVDQLGRGPFAYLLLGVLKAVDASHGAVVGVTGA